MQLPLLVGLLTAIKTIFIILDLSAAFDAINHYTIIKNLLAIGKTIGLSDTTIDGFRSRFYDCTQSIYSDESLSNPSFVRHGSTSRLGIRSFCFSYLFPTSRTTPQESCTFFPFYSDDAKFISAATLLLLLATRNLSL